VFQNRTQIKNKVGSNFSGNIVLPLVFIAVMLIGALISPLFFSAQNLRNIIIGSATFGILASGMTVILIAGEIDLSVGSQVALTSVVMATLAPRSLTLAIFVSILVTVSIGIVNGVLLTKTKMPSFVLTLSTMGIVRSIALVIGDGQPVYGVPRSYANLANASVGGIPLVALALVVIYLLTWFFLKYTTLGRSIYSVGSNAEAARLTGINVNRIKVAAYAISGFMAGLAGLYYTSYVTLGLPDGAVDYETEAITAAIIGGASFFGGEGQVTNTLLGFLIVAIVKNILNLMGVSPFVQPVAIGLLIIVAVGVRTMRKS
jgi:ribose/xylose/arabinose/galactoside ABC-type transport system permease subunit